MGLLRQMWLAQRQMKEFQRLWATPNAYRPSGSAPGRRGDYQPDEVLHRLADYGNQLGMTSGDVGGLAVIFLRRVDHHRSYDAALDDLLRAVREGRIRTVAGPPMHRFVSADAVVNLVEMVAVAGRPEAFAESMLEEEEQGEAAVPRGDTSRALYGGLTQEYVAALLREYRTLAAEPAPLLAEADRMRELREELNRYGVDPDES